jgi:hypothetical protein
MVRRAFALSVVLAILVLHFSALTHVHNGVTARKCGICHVADVPVIAVALHTAVAPELLIEWTQHIRLTQHELETLLVTSPSRAPPA